SFKDLFRTEKKAKVIANIYDLLHSEDVDSAEKDSTSVENKSKRVNLGPISIFNKIIEYANEANQHLFSIKYNNDEDTISFNIANTILKTVHIADVFEMIKIDNQNFVDNYGKILRTHHSKSYSSTIVTESKNKVKIEGADDLRRYSSPFYSDNPELVDYLNNSKIYDYDTFCRVSDKMTAPRKGVDPDFLARREYNVATVFDHLLKFNETAKLGNVGTVANSPLGATFP
ncbi:hypothetical protein ACNSPD_01480, partial [Yersinia enterocolitica]